MKVAIVGTGISGLVAARELHPDHDVTVFEADARVGGHANTVDIELDGEAHRVDTGFIVYNEANYPGFTALLRALGVATQPTEMSFSVADARTGLEYRGSNLNTLFAQRRNLARPAFLRLVTEIMRFNRAARRLVADEPRWHGADRLPGADARGDDDEPIDAFLQRGRYSRSFVEQFLVPFGAAIWSADPATFTRFPMRSYARFMHNHGLLEAPGRARWRTITGGSRCYVDALTEPFTERIRLSTPVHKIVTRTDTGSAASVEVLTDRGPERFDHVVVATHSDQALRMLGDATQAEQSVLGPIKYQHNTATLHTDARLLPRKPRARASWNYSVDPDSRRATVTYWMNSLQAIDTIKPLLVTLNREGSINPAQVLARVRLSPSRLRRGGYARPAPPSRDPGHPRHQLCRCVLGIRIPRGRRAERTRSRALDRDQAMSAVAIYEGTVRHRRVTPKAREFAPSLFLAYLDVDALPESLDSLPGWSARRRALVRFRREDFLNGQDGPLGDAVRDLVQARLGRRPDGPIHLLAHLRTFGWSFNPLAVYYCWTADESALDAVVLEVTNTPWGERHWYVLDAQADATTRTVDKEMHVSPFLPMDVEYHVSWTAPGETLRLDIVVEREGTTLFEAGLALQRTILDRRHAVTTLLRYPLMPMRASLAIYRQAVALFLARVPLYRHPPRRAQEVGV